MTKASNPMPTSPKAILIAAAVSLALIYASQSGSIMRHILSDPAISSVPYLRSLLASLSDIIVMLAATCFVAFSSPISLLKKIGYSDALMKPLLWAGFIFIPAIFVCVLTTPIASNFTVYDFAWQSIGGPIFEEIFYRGLAVAFLIRLCGWHWSAACLLPAIFFGAAHIWQGSDWGSIIGIIAITGLGGLLFGWVFYRWNFNILPPVLLHIGMNAIWLLFSMGETALGGWFGNALRLLIVFAAIALSLYMSPKK